MNYKVKSLDNDEVIEQGHNLASLTVLEEKFVVIKTDGKSSIFDKMKFYIVIADCGFNLAGYSAKF